MSQHAQPTGPHVREMAMLMRMLLKHVPEDKQAHRLAMHYLQKYDLTGSPLRNEPDRDPSIDLMQRVWANLYYDEADAGFTYQHTLNEVVDWLADRNALPDISPEAPTSSKEEGEPHA